jgi:hypothetical protein
MELNENFVVFAVEVTDGDVVIGDFCLVAMKLFNDFLYTKFSSRKFETQT